MKETFYGLIVGICLGAVTGGLGYSWWTDADRLNMQHKIKSLEVDRELSVAYKNGLAATGKFYQGKINELKTNGHCAGAKSVNSRLLLEADNRSAHGDTRVFERPTGYSPSNADTDAWAIKLRAALEQCRMIVFARNHRNEQNRKVGK